jgi:hypothetical protein
MNILVSKQHRGWQLNKVLQTADSMCSLRYWIPSEVILTIKGVKADSNMEATAKAIGFESAKVYTIGQNKTTGEAILLAAKAADAASKKGGCAVICDGHHKFYASWLAETFGKVAITPIVRDVEADIAERVAHEANLAQRTGAALANDEILMSIVTLRKAGVYTKQADLPFQKNDRGNHQKFWYRSEAIVNHGYTVEQVAKLEWQTCKKLCEGIAYETALIDTAEKKNANKVVTADTIKSVATIAENKDADGKDALTVILKKMAAGDNDGVKQAVVAYYNR